MDIAKLFDRYYFQPVSKIAGTVVLMAIRNSFIITLPIVMTGALAILVNNFPVSAYQSFMLALVGENWRTWGGNVFNGTFAAMSLVLAFSIGYNLTIEHNARRKIKKVSPPITAVVTFASTMVIMYPSGDANSLLPWLGLNGMFLTIALSLLSGLLFINIFSFLSLKGNFFAEEADFEIPSAMAALIPAFVTVSLFAVLRAVLTYYGKGDLYQLTYDIIRYPFLGLDNSIFAAALYVFMIQFLWCFGIHGANVLNPITSDMYVGAMDRNIAAFSAGLPVSEIFTKTFFDVFIFMGGSGATICLLLAVFIFSTRNSTRKIGQISLVPAIFNINELLVFGLPIVLNPFFLVPFILCPFVIGVLSYLFTLLGVLPYTYVNVDWTTPPLINAYIATGGSLKAVFVQILNIIIGMFIYFPFVKAYDRHKEESFKNIYARLVTVALEGDIAYQNSTILTREDEIGTAARSLAGDLRQAFVGGELYMEYQPQINMKTQQVAGVEALLRWNHRLYGQIPPPLIISLSEDSGNIHELGLWILEEAARQLAEWKSLGAKDVRVSVNISMAQLGEPALPAKVKTIMARYDIQPGELGIEVAESIILSRNTEIQTVFHTLHDMGVRVVVDNFGMSHNSLLSLRQLPVDMIKVHRTLSRDVLTDPSCADFLAAILELSKIMEVCVMVEYVEGYGQFQKLTEIGIDYFQGYLFSKPLSANDVVRYTQKVNYAGILIEDREMMEKVLT